MGIAVETGVAWPTAEVRLTYEGHEIVLTPETENLMPTVAVHYQPPMTYVSAVALLRRFLSSLAWVKQKSITEVFSAGGGALPKLGKSPAGIIDPRFRADYLPAPSDPKARLALALYREGLSVNSPAFQFLSFYKITNLLHRRGHDQVAWIDATVDTLDDYDARKRLSELRTGGESIGNYLHVSCRCAVAHAFSDPIVDPDDPKDRERISRDLCLIQALAEHAIEKEIGVKSQRTVSREHLYELEGFRSLWGEDVVAAIKVGITPGARLPVPRLSLRLRDRAQLEAFESMQVTVEDVDHGKVVLACCEMRSS